MRKKTRKIINEEGRLFGVISVIDIFVLAVVAALAFAVLAKGSPTGAPASTVNTVPVSYTIYVNAIRESNADLLRKGDFLYTDSGTYIGSITNAEKSDAVRLSSLSDGSLVIGKVEERYDVLLTVSVPCSVSGGRYYADRTYELCANTDQKLVTKYNAMNGVIMDIWVENDG